MYIFYANEWNWWGAAPTYTIYTRGGVNYLTLTLILGDGVNYLTLRVQFYANECNEGRDANP